jgi:hypothetical protein
MAMSKKKSRAITVNEIPYRYSVQHSLTLRNEDGSLNLNIVVQHESGDGCYLKVIGVYTRDFWLDISDHKHESSEYLKVTPKHIAKIIEMALEEGWQPTVKAPPFNFKADNAYLRSL